MTLDIAKIALRMKEDRRLVILRCLESVPEYTVNSKVLSLAIEDQGHMVNNDILMSDLAWLTEQGLITTAKPYHDLMVLKLTLRGLDVAEGKATVPGVKRPDPSLDD
jgi:hypothetical protein